MITELSKITQDLEQGKITEGEARNLLLDLLGVRLSLPTVRDICKKAKIIKKELDDDNQEFCQASYLMGALDFKNGDIACNEA